MTKKEAAKKALQAHDHLRRVNDAEPALDEGGMPLNEIAWRGWYDARYKPALEAWKRAMDSLDDTLGENINRHPHIFRPLCEKLLGEHES